MADEVFSHQLPESAAPRSLWSSLSRWWVSPAASPLDAALGYESAHPWALDDAVGASQEVAVD